MPTRPTSPLRLALALALIAAAAACATNPVTGRKEISLLSEAQEIAIGQQADAEVRREMGIYDDRELERYVSDIGMQLARASHRPHLPWSFTVVDSPAVNAFALPGGFIYITRGILPYLADESELAGVLGHEIGHVTARHAAQQYTRATGGSIGLIAASIFVPAVRPFGDLASTGLSLFFLKYGRGDELESDRLGIEYAGASGWDPSGVPRFLSTLSHLDEMSTRGVPNWLSTHPEPASRVDEALPLASKAAATTKTERNADVFLRHIDGIVYGDNPKDGIVRGREFLHPAMRFALEFPEGWEVQNTPDQVAAREPGVNHYMLLQIADQPRGRPLERVATDAMRSGRFTPIDGASTRINGLEAYLGTYRGDLKGVGAARVRAAHIMLGRQVYLVAGFAPEAEFARIEAQVDAAMATFRELSRAEADAIRPNRLDFYTVREGDTWQSIASRAGRSIVRAPQLAVMNGYAVNVQPTAGDRIKIVVAG